MSSQRQDRQAALFLLRLNFNNQLVLTILLVAGYEKLSNSHFFSEFNIFRNKRCEKLFQSFDSSFPQIGSNFLDKVQIKVDYEATERALKGLEASNCVRNWARLATILL